ncbi:hypothetical protein FSPOR_1973 [Fusarium sporotrichioides]|uniref:Peroxidase n=1 Tax=Fusarium sporotrichioides TaxID=5514 RepID=A0A395SN91_FUSSP|nr:hypothetical protein FSPOR_1973 [Fusarium sporotrichioides]
MKGPTTVAIALVPFTAAKQLVWPSKFDYLEDLQYNQGGYNKFGFADALVTCTFGNSQPGRQNSAEWIRTAFHDAVTHDAKAGTGGLDASIFWETNRAENPGDAWNNTFGFFSGFHNQRASAADLIALGTVVATKGCTGPDVPFRAGRIDAGKPGPSGVPEPSTNLKETFAAFQKAGFTKEDMTAMVACGHALGGVHSVDFPDVTGIKADPNNDTSVPFQKDVSSFHNGVVTEYLDGTTKNPLVVAKNNTLNSDKRIFDDDRATMKKLATKEGFNTMCADIFARMIDTVPKSVQLTDVISPYDVKPYVKELSLNSKGEIVFKGSVRLMISNNIRDPDDLVVQLVYMGHNGKKTTVSTTKANWQSGISAGSGQSFVNFEFDTTIDAKNGITKFWIKETKKSTGVSKSHDNQGTHGYKVDDTVLYQIGESCVDAAKLPSAPMTVNAVVRDSSAKNALSLKVTHKIDQQGTMVPKLQTEITNFKATGKKLNGYTAFKAQTKLNDNGVWFDIALAGNAAAGVQFQGALGLPSCS